VQSFDHQSAPRVSGASGNVCFVHTAEGGNAYGAWLICGSRKFSFTFLAGRVFGARFSSFDGLKLLKLYGLCAGGIRADSKLQPLVLDPASAWCWDFELAGGLHYRFSLIRGCV
jgi:hypothetical protein